MNGYCIETKDLFHKFSNKEIAVNHINLKIQEGSIYGFLGPNGAGKTTTLRLLLGLLKKQQGEIYVFGKKLEQNRISILRKLGSLIENPSLYGQLTALENLKVLQKIYRCADSRLQEVLQMVQLANTGNKKAGQFSLGMKQRLNIAMTLLHDPALLILDEPTNGLDPKSILEMRELLKRLNANSGITILISSHLLPEIEKLATHVGIINKGTLIFQGTLDQLKTQQNTSSFSYVSTDDNTIAQNILSSQNISSIIKEEKIIIQSLSKEELAGINQLLVENKLKIYELGNLKNDLETVFMNLVNTI